MRAMYMYGGGRMCFPVRDCWCLPVSHCICHRSCPFVPRSLFLPGRPDVFSWPRLCTTSSPLLHSSILLISTSSSRASMVWTDTVFGVARLAAHFEARRWFSGCRLHPRARSQETGQAIPGVYLAPLVLCVFLSSSKYGEVRIQISGRIWSSQCQTCHRLGDRFLSRPPARRSGSGGALREERPQDHRLGGRLASSAGV